MRASEDINNNNYHNRYNNYDGYGYGYGYGYYEETSLEVKGHGIINYHQGYENIGNGKHQTFENNLCAAQV